MSGLFDAAKSYLVARKFKRSALGQALAEHTKNYFYSGKVLSWMDQPAKDRIIQDFYGKLVTIGQSQQPIMDLRNALVEYTLTFAQLSVLSLTEEEKAEQFYAASPYISGELHRHIEKAAPHNEELARLIWQKGELSGGELVSYANSRSALMAYYVNGLNMARIDMGDRDSAKDWFRPFVEAMLVWEEDGMREKLGIPRLVPGPLHALPYSTFLNSVVNGEANPFFTWTRTFPDLYLAGEGPLLDRNAQVAS